MLRRTEDSCERINRERPNESVQSLSLKDSYQTMIVDPNTFNESKTESDSNGKLGSNDFFELFLFLVYLF